LFIFYLDVILLTAHITDKDLFITMHQEDICLKISKLLRKT